MGCDGAFEEIGRDIRAGRLEAAAAKAVEAASSCGGDAAAMLKCASVLKAIGDEEGCRSIVSAALESAPDDPDEAYGVGIAARNLGRAEEALALVLPMRGDPARAPEVARTLMLAGECEEALAVMEPLDGGTPADRVLLSEILRSLGEFRPALEAAESAAAEDGGSYESLAACCAAMISMGDAKGAMRLARTRLKQDKGGADASALAAYVMRVMGRIPAAANYANRALRADASHAGALETMALCLAEKGRIDQARYFAGALNEQRPGSLAVARVLDACRALGPSGPGPSCGP